MQPNPLMWAMTSAQQTALTACEFVSDRSYQPVRLTRHRLCADMGRRTASITEIRVRPARGLTMHITLGQPVITHDGLKVGEIDRIVLDATGHQIEQIIVHRGRLVDDDRVIARSEIERVDTEGVHLSITAADVADLPHFEPGAPAGSAPGTSPVAPGPSQGFILLSPGPVGSGFLDADPLYSLDALGESAGDEVESRVEIVIGKGSDVYDVEGHRIGHVFEMAYVDDGTLASIVVRTGVVRHHDLTVPVDLISELLDDHVLLNVAARDLSPG